MTPGDLNKLKKPLIESKLRIKIIYDTLKHHFILKYQEEHVKSDGQYTNV